MLSNESLNNDIHKRRQAEPAASLLLTSLLKVKSEKVKARPAKWSGFFIV
jgi:hypothetical protein